jgi:hypothetical protein
MSSPTTSTGLQVQHRQRHLTHYDPADGSFAAPVGAALACFPTWTIFSSNETLAKQCYYYAPTWTPSSPASVYYPTRGRASGIHPWWATTKVSPDKLHTLAKQASSLLGRAASNAQWLPRQFATFAEKALLLYLAISPTRFFFRELNNVPATRNNWEGSVRLTYAPNPTRPRMVANSAPTTQRTLHIQAH